MPLCKMINLSQDVVTNFPKKNSELQVELFPRNHDKEVSKPSSSFMINTTKLQK